MNLVYIDKVKYNQQQFSDKVRDISDRLNTDPNWLMYVMWFESGLDHMAQNPQTNATGLIQFMPSTATNLGTSTTDLMHMSNVDQLNYVYEYLRPYKGKLDSLVDVYLAIFFPAAIGKGSDYILQTSKLSAGLVARQNPIFDLDHNGQITRNEIEAKILSGMPPIYPTSVKKKPMKFGTKEITIAVAVLTIAIAVLQIYKQLKQT